MSNGLAINIPTSFNRVLSDLSFIPDVQPDKLAYTGLYGDSAASSSVNAKVGGASSNIQVVEVRNGDRVAYGDGYFSVTGTGAGTSGGTGVRAQIKLPSIDRNGSPCSLVTTFRNIKKVREVTPSIIRLYPIISFYYSPAASEGSEFLTIAAGINDSGSHYIAAFSGALGGASSDALAFVCSVDVDWSATSDLITAGISRAPDGTVSLAVLAAGQVKTATHKFPVVADATATLSYALFGSQSQRTLDSAEFIAGQYWHNTALTLPELQQQVAVTQLKSNSRI